MTLALSPLTPTLVAETDRLRVTTCAPTGRLSLRARADRDRIETALGFELPAHIGHRSKADAREAVCLGPDEWTILTPADAVGKLVDALAAIYPDQPHALTDISAREVTFIIEGTDAAELLAISCPRDISTIAAGDARRTLFDGAAVVLWCDTPQSFRMDVWNSFAPFIAQTLQTGCRELAAEIA